VKLSKNTGGGTQGASQNLGGYFPPGPLLEPPLAKPQDKITSLFLIYAQI